MVIRRLLLRLLDGADGNGEEAFSEGMLLYAFRRFILYNCTAADAMMTNMKENNDGRQKVMCYFWLELHVCTDFRRD